MAPRDFETLLRASIGLNAASIGSSAVARAVQQRLTACKLPDHDAYWDCVRASDAELQALIEAVVVPETWFFRDRESFTALGRLVRDEMLREKAVDPVSLLSLPCSTGEEPYSMAMALLDAGVPADRFRVHAVDVSEAVLSYAARAVYGRNSFRGGELSFRDRYFAETPGAYRLSERVQEPVQFQRGNLFEEGQLSGPARYDVIFCRNVLIYFDRETQDRAMGILTRLLTPKGVLFVAPAETGLPASHGFVPTDLQLAFAFRRGDSVALPRGHAIPERLPPPRRVPPAARATPPLRARVAGPVAPHLRPPMQKAVDAATDMAEATRLADQGHFVEAATSCEAHLRQHGPSAAAYYLLGLVRDATGNQAEARDYYRKALYLDPAHREAQIQLAFLMEKQGDAAGARVLLNRAHRLGRKT